MVTGPDTSYAVLPMFSIKRTTRDRELESDFNSGKLVLVLKLFLEKIYFYFFI